MKAMSDSLPPRQPYKPKSESGPENLGDILGRLFVTRGWGRLSERTQLETAWGEVAAEEFGPVTRVAGLRRGILEIEVKNAVVIQESELLAHSAIFKN